MKKKIKAISLFSCEKARSRALVSVTAKLLSPYQFSVKVCNFFSGVHSEIESIFLIAVRRHRPNRPKTTIDLINTFTRQTPYPLFRPALFPTF